MREGCNVNTRLRVRVREMAIECNVRRYRGSSLRYRVLPRLAVVCWLYMCYLDRSGVVPGKN